MVRTQLALEELLDYEAVAEIHALEVPNINKADIAKYIVCPNFEKSMEGVERARARYQERIDDLLLRVAEREDDVRELEKAFRKVNPDSPPSKPGSLLGPSETPENIASYNREVREYNDRLQQARRLQERISDATDRHRDMVEKHDDAVREAEEKLEDMAEEALLSIDEDIAAFLEKALQITINLADSEEAEDLMAAVETCFIVFRIYNGCAGFIESNAARKSAEQETSQFLNLFVALLANEGVRTAFLNVFSLNSAPIDKNAELNGKIVEIIESVDKESLDEMTRTFQPLLNREFYSDFKYEGIVDPAELDSVVDEMHQTIEKLKTHINKVTEMEDSTRTIAEESVKVQQQIDVNLATMKSNVETIGDNLLTKDHFICEMLNAEVIEHFYNSDGRDAVLDFHRYMAGDLGDKQFEAILNEEADRFSIHRTEAAIQEANILRLQDQRDKVAGYISKLSTQIKDIDGHVEGAAEVPQQNADQFSSTASVFYILSCLPVFGFIFSLVMQSKINKFAPAFKSPLEIYYELGTAILEKNTAMQKVILILGGVFGFGGMGLLFGTGLGAKFATSLKMSAMAVNIALPCVLTALYVITWIVLSNAGKSLQSYIGSSEATPETELESEKESSL